MRPKLLFLITEDWFFASHFLPLARRALAEGYEPIVAARNSNALCNVAAEGVRLVDMPFARGSLRPDDIWREVAAVRALLRRERPAIVHAIALKPIVLLLFSGERAASRVFAVTGRGYAGARETVLNRLISGSIARRLRGALTDRHALLLVENRDDRHWVEGSQPLADESVMTMPGAGVDTDVFTAGPEPAVPPVVIGIAARLIRSKGIDLAIAALERLRSEGLDVELHIAGASDEMNPDNVSDSTLEVWRQTPGVRLLGKMTDIPAFWAERHIACLPSRGGEGLPRSLLEAASCGRAIVTSDVPGCRDFVRDGETGFVTRREDVDALAAKLDLLCRDAEARARMGRAGRELVLTQYTERHAADVAAQAWSRVRRRKLR